uniref:Serine protease 16 (thymus) n=1 Tax=Mus spicilegus TaxID=10103 RepID=A0A8C6G774_MUSSI
ELCLPESKSEAKEDAGHWEGKFRGQGVRLGTSPRRCSSKEGKSRSPRESRFSLSEVSGGGLHRLHGGGAAAARRPGGSGCAEGGTGRLRVPGPYRRPGGAAGSVAGAGGRHRAVRRAGGSAAKRAPALRSPAREVGKPQPLYALLGASPGCTDVTCEGLQCPFSQLPALPFQLELCEQVFGLSPASVAQAVAQTNSYYGGQSPGATQVLFVNGDTDPWHVLSVTQDLGLSEPALLIPSASHCFDMAPMRPSDSPSLRLGRQKISQQLQDWLKDIKKSQS